MDRTDKVSQGYLPFYLSECARLSRRAADDRRTPVVIELGVAGGAGLRLFRDLMPEALLVGVDRDLTHFSDADRDAIGAWTVCGDQADPNLLNMILEIIDREASYRNPPVGVCFDLVVDDASHDGINTARSFNMLWPHVSAGGGLYVVEDWFVGFNTHPDYDASMLRWAQDLLYHLTYQPDDPRWHMANAVRSMHFQHGLIGITKY